jgi:hypothetical protein
VKFVTQKLKMHAYQEELNEQLFTYMPDYWLVGWFRSMSE